MINLTDVNLDLKKTLSSGNTSSENFDKKELELITKNWLNFGTMACSICKLNFAVLKIEEHELKCRNDYMSKENGKFVSILLNFTEYPDDWSKGMTENLRLDEIDSRDPAYIKIQNRFESAIKTVKILKIERIQNKYLWDKYTREKNRLLGEKGSVKENLLWHGCKGAGPNFILKTGFDISFASDGGLFGRGLYFARLASYSCPSYCWHDKEKGIYYVFLAKVLSGVTHVAPSGSGFKKPPFWNEEKMIYYDSVTNHANVDSDDVNQMFVVYDNDKAYPYYLVAYKI
jgi:hypothetical protein